MVSATTKTNFFKFKIRIETLESRVLLDSGGLISSASAHLTLSFVPDGTDISGHNSALYSSLNSISEESVWQETILSAFQHWAANTNGDIGVVEDSGEPMGTPGPRFGDSRFGDVRIGAAPLSENVLAISIPTNLFVSGSWVGDVIFNSRAEFSSIDQLFSVAIHEAGHVFGLEHVEEEQSVMHLHGASPNTTLTESDLHNLHSLYGQRSPDINDAEEPNDHLDDATKLRSVKIPNHGKGSRLRSFLETSPIHPTRTFLN